MTTFSYHNQNALMKELQVVSFVKVPVDIHALEENNKICICGKLLYTLCLWLQMKTNSRMQFKD